MNITTNRTRSIFITIILLAIVIGVVFIGARLLMTGSPKEPEEPGDLEPVEIREYQGQMLSAIADFRENSILGPQYVDKVSYRLVVTGLVNNTLVYTYDEVINKYAQYEKIVTLHCVEGWDVTILWEGVLLKDLFADAGIDSSAKVVIFYAYDDYTTSLPLDYILDNNILMAYKMNGLVIPPERGFPFQLVAESKYGYKWIKWITKIELSDDVNYLGYWESYGFDNDADLP
jgi:DMSO/TMAO reductase YedYZ molybdopterin-dependent catalytic subunit